MSSNSTQLKLVLKKVVAQEHTHAQRKRAGLILSTQHGSLKLTSPETLLMFFGKGNTNHPPCAGRLLLSFQRHAVYLFDFLVGQIHSNHFHWLQAGGEQDDFGYTATWDMSLAQEGGPITVTSRERRARYDLGSNYRAQWQGLYLPVSAGVSGLQ